MPLRSTLPPRWLRFFLLLWLNLDPASGTEVFTENFAYSADTTIVNTHGGVGFSGPWVSHALWPEDQGSFLQVAASSLVWPGQNTTGGHLRFNGGNGSYRHNVVRRPLSENLQPGEYTFSFVYQNSNPSASGSSSHVTLLGANDNSLRLTFHQSTELLVNGTGTGAHIRVNTPQRVRVHLQLRGPGQTDTISLWVNPAEENPEDPHYISNTLDVGTLTTLEVGAWGNQTILWDTLRLIEGAEVLEPPPPPPEPALQQRDPWQRPFAQKSIWNMPRGANAELIAANLPLTYQGSSPYLGLDLERHIQVPAGSPLRPIFPPAGWPILWPGNSNFSKPSTAAWANIPLPDDFYSPDNTPTYTPNGCTTFLMPDGRTLRQMQPTVRLWDDNVPDRRIVGWPANPIDLYGHGITGSHWGSGLSTLGGSLRVGELSSAEPIRHALKLNIWVRHMYYGDSKGFRWPADRADSYASASTYTGTNPALQMGSLLVLPANVTPQSLNITSAPALKIFAALRDYGCYISDDTAWNAYDFCVEKGVKEEVADMGHTLGGYTGGLNEELKRIISALHVVNDNSPQTPGGAGPRMTALAPRLVDPLFSQPLSFTALRQGDNIQLSWENPGTWSPQAYEVERKTAEGPWMPLGDLTGLTYTDSPSNPEDAFTYRVRGVQESTGNGGIWASVSVEASVSAYTAWLDQYSVTDGETLRIGGHALSTWSAFVMGAVPGDSEGSSLLRTRWSDTGAPAAVIVDGSPNRRYRLQVTDDLRHGEWQNSGETLSGEGRLIFPLPSTGEKTFFRITVETPSP